jgi:tyrosinase
MKTEIKIEGTGGAGGAGASYIGWAPVRASIRLVEADGAVNPVPVELRNQNPAQGGQVVFLNAIPGVGQNTLQLTLPVNGTAVNFFVAGNFNRPSLADRDAIIRVVRVNPTVMLSTTRLMVRVRKNANNLTVGERNRFLSAFTRLNVTGGFNQFRAMHTDDSDFEAHAGAGFLPWHRAYLLDLERAIQSIDPSVTLPYWKFDEPAPKLFTRDFIGESDAAGSVQFSSTNPLRSWATDGQLPGIDRRPLFDAKTSPASVTIQGLVRRPRNEFETDALGGAQALYASFRTMQTNPHNLAHITFDGYISSVPTAARDPLFFLLHTNIDRLWAKWQWHKKRFNPTVASTFQGTPRVGHRLNDTMWPWNQITGSGPPAGRPPTAPGGNFDPSTVVSAPGLTPRVRDMIDHQGVVTSASRLAFDYDDVPFEFA